MKGHNWDHGRGDVCKACGEIHVHPSRGRPAWNRGLSVETDPRIASPPSWNKGLTKETDPRVARAAETHRRTLREHPRTINGDTRRKISASVHRIWERRRQRAGKAHLTNEDIYGEAQARLIKLKKSIAMSLVHARRRLREVEDFYGLELSVPTASLRDHKFARDVLIEGKSRRGYYERTGLLEHPNHSSRFPGDDDLVARARWPERDGPDDSA